MGQLPNYHHQHPIEVGWTRWLLSIVFVFSGLAALVYEVSWSRQIGLVLGHTAQANSVVLMAYFTGLALGQRMGGRLAGRMNPLLSYGLCELLAGAFAFVVPLSLSHAESHASTVQFVLCFASVLPATVALGATFPLMAEYLLQCETQTECRTLWYYALNTVGGFLGVILSVAFLLVVMGVRGSGYCASGISVFCGVVACGLVLFSHGLLGQRQQLTPITTMKPVPVRWEWQFVAAVSGFVSLALQVLYTRLFALVFHNSTYTFAVIIAVFLVGLTLGAVVVATVLRRMTPRTLVIYACSVGPVAITLSVVMFARITNFQYFSAGETFAGYLTQAFGLVMLIVIPPVLLIGILFPAALAACDHTGRSVSRLVVVNLLAGVAGAAVAGFFLIPQFGLWLSFSVLASLSCIPGVLFFAMASKKFLAGSVGMIAIGFAVLSEVDLKRIFDIANDHEVVIQQWESAYGRIDVVQEKNNGSLRVRQNLHYRHGSTSNAVREYRQGRLPLLLHSQPTEVAFLGIGTGLTAAPVVNDRRIKQAILVELIPEVIEAARMLKEANLGVCDHPKVTLVLDDARHYVGRTNQQFDVIISDLFVPWESRTGYLYTVEFYQAVRRRLIQGGMFCQWLALYQLGPREFELIAESFAAVFPNVTLWWGQFDSRYPIIALCSSDKELEWDKESLADRFTAMDAMPSGVDPDLGKPSDLHHLFLGRWPARPLQTLNTDEHPWLEFRAPIIQQGRTLSGRVFMSYFDTVLSKLPDNGVRWKNGFANFGASETARRRAVQRLSFFGEVNE